MRVAGFVSLVLLFAALPAGGHGNSTPPPEPEPPPPRDRPPPPPEHPAEPPTWDPTEPPTTPQDTPQDTPTPPQPQAPAGPRARADRTALGDERGRVALLVGVQPRAPARAPPDDARARRGDRRRPRRRARREARGGPRDAPGDRGVRGRADGALLRA